MKQNTRLQNAYSSLKGLEKEYGHDHVPILIKAVAFEHNLSFKELAAFYLVNKKNNK